MGSLSLFHHELQTKARMMMIALLLVDADVLARRKDDNAPPMDAAKGPGKTAKRSHSSSMRIA